MSLVGPRPEAAGLRRASARVVRSDRDGAPRDCWLVAARVRQRGSCAGGPRSSRSLRLQDAVAERLARRHVGAMPATSKSRRPSPRYAWRRTHAAWRSPPSWRRCCAPRAATPEKLQGGAVQPAAQRDPPHAGGRERHGARRADGGAGSRSRSPTRGRASRPRAGVRARPVRARGRAGPPERRRARMAIVEAQGGRRWPADTVIGTRARFIMPT
jgi:hypothetical protein